MKKINTSLIIGIVWIVVAFLFFSINKIGVGMVWLVVGIITLIQAIRIMKLNKKIDELMEQSEETVEVSEAEETFIKTKTIIETIMPSKEVHTIFDEYIGYGYDVNKAFKPAKSHAGEVDLLCTYAPSEEYGQEGNLPCIAIQTDDEVYCAVEEYKESKNWDKAGFCLVYPKEYVGTKDEEKLIHILDEAAKSFGKR